MPVAPQAPQVRTRRRPGLVALGVALVATGALGTAWLVGSAGDRVAVVAVARPVPYGAVLSSADLTTAEVSVDPAVPTVPADRISELLGQTATVPLLAGTLLAPEAVAPVAPPLSGQVLVGVALRASRMPAVELAAGDVVRVVSTPPQDADPPPGTPSTITATVVRVGPTDLDGVNVIDVAVDAAQGPVLAAWSATGRVALVLEARGAS